MGLMFMLPIGMAHMVSGEQMFHRGQPVESLSIHDALRTFTEFIEGLPGANAILIGHNIKTFDCHVLMSTLTACHLDQRFSKKVTRYLGTLQMFKLLKPGLPSYTQTNLVNDVLGLEYLYDAHNAVSDVTSLKSLFDASTEDEEVRRKFTRDSDYVLESLWYAKQIKVSLPSLELFVQSKKISNMMAKKIAGSDLRFQHLTTVFLRLG